MSFIEQERVLFDLLFDHSLRADFAQDADAVLNRYDLEEKERNDFRTIRIDALMLDASMRKQLLLSTISHAYPVTFSLVSAIPSGPGLLKDLIDTETMHTPPIQRATVFGKRLRDRLQTIPMARESERPLLLALAEVETGMAWTAATLKQHVVDAGKVNQAKDSLPDNWSSLPMKLADFVSVAMLPLSYQTLKQQLGNNNGGDTWSKVSVKPLAAARMSRVLETQHPALLVAQARLEHASACEPGITHQTLELSEGFAHLFQHINGSSSVDQLLAGFKQAGAPQNLVDSVKTGFRKLVDMRMLIICKTS